MMASCCRGWAAGVALALFEKDRQRSFCREAAAVEGVGGGIEESLFVEITGLEGHGTLGPLQIGAERLAAVVAAGNILEGGTELIGGVVTAQPQGFGSASGIEDQRGGEIGVLPDRELPLGQGLALQFGHLVNPPDVDRDDIEVTAGVGDDIVHPEVDLQQQLAVGTATLTKVDHDALFIRSEGFAQICG
jgi:hypothetical protein